MSGRGGGTAGLLVTVVAEGAGAAAPGLVDRLGSDRVGALSQLLLDRAVAAASALPEARVEVVAGTEVGDQIRALGSGSAGGGGPGGRRLLVVWPRLPRWRPAHLTAAIADLDAGCGVSVAPVFDGGLYVLALGRAVPELLALDDDVLVGARATGELLGAAGAAGLEVGLLRAERALRRPGDVDAALADPLLDGELRRLLEG